MECGPPLADWERELLEKQAADQCEARAAFTADALTLERAVSVLERRARRRTFTLGVLCRVLELSAAKLRKRGASWPA